MSGGNAKARVWISMSESEYQEFMQVYNSTTCRNMSAYAKKLLLGKPVTVMYRNRSLDDFIESAVQLRKELKLIVLKDSLTNSEKSELRRKLDGIESNLIKIVELCSQR